MYTSFRDCSGAAALSWVWLLTSRPEARAWALAAGPCCPLASCLTYPMLLALTPSALFACAGADDALESGGGNVPMHQDAPVDAANEYGRAPVADGAGKRAAPSSPACLPSSSSAKRGRWRLQLPARHPHGASTGAAFADLCPPLQVLYSTAFDLPMILATSDTLSAALEVRGPPWSRPSTHNRALRPDAFAH